EGDAALEEGEAPVELGALPGEALRRQPEARHERRVEVALEREVVDGEQAWRLALFLEAEVHRTERRGPVVAMHDVRAPGDGRARGGEERRGPGEKPEAHAVVLPVGPRLVLVRAPASLIKRRAIEQQEFG